MDVCTTFPAPTPGTLAWSVKCALDGYALGDAASWRAWGLPPLYASGVRFAYEPEHGTGREEFASPPVVCQRGWGDCDDLVRYRVAELLAAQLTEFGGNLWRLRLAMAEGRAASIITRWQGDDLHVLVRLPNGQEEDPSIRLGAPT